jgi:hypothetical protein
VLEAPAGEEELQEHFDLPRKQKANLAVKSVCSEAMHRRSEALKVSSQAFKGRVRVPCCGAEDHVHSAAGGVACCFCCCFPHHSSSLAINPAPSACLHRVDVAQAVIDVGAISLLNWV